MTINQINTSDNNLDLNEASIKEIFNIIEKINVESKDFDEFRHTIDSFMSTTLKDNPELTKYIYKCLKESLNEFLKSVELSIEVENRFQRKHKTQNPNIEVK